MGWNFDPSWSANLSKRGWSARRTFPWETGGRGWRRPRLAAGSRGMRLWHWPHKTWPWTACGQRRSPTWLRPAVSWSWPTRRKWSVQPLSGARAQPWRARCSGTPVSGPHRTGATDPLRHKWLGRRVPGHPIVRQGPPNSGAARRAAPPSAMRAAAGSAQWCRDGGPRASRRTGELTPSLLIALAASRASRRSALATDCTTRAAKRWRSAVTGGRPSSLPVRMPPSSGICASRGTPKAAASACPPPRPTGSHRSPQGQAA